MSERQRANPKAHRFRPRPGPPGADHGRKRTPDEVPAPRLTRSQVTLDDGHVVSVAVAGEGVPFVVVHGFMAEGFMYAQTLGRLVSLGYKVVAIDTAAHGGTDVLPEGEVDFGGYVDLLSRALDHLGIRRAVLVGHSMGGRIVAELAAAAPERAVAVILLDPILGRPWDRLVARARAFPPLLAWLGLLIAVDTLATLPLLADRRQARTVLGFLAPTVRRDVLRPWRLLAPAIAILRSGSSGAVLESLRCNAVPTVIVHGERDLVVPLATARDAAERSGGDLVVVHGGTHSWLIRDPETLPAVVSSLSEGRLGEAYDAALRDAGLDPASASVADVEAAFYAPGARVVALTPPLAFEPTAYRLRPPRYEFTAVEVHDGPEASGLADAGAATSGADADDAA
jgi:pimeloyl-ACP methyl ester carboxylesterase